SLVPLSRSIDRQVEEISEKKVRNRSSVVGFRGPTPLYPRVSGARIDGFRSLDLSPRRRQTVTTQSSTGKTSNW
ncbi:unnamed protein product, partial [Musa textilis]